MKTCPQCKTEKPIDLFYLMKSGKHDSVCIECKKANSRAEHWANREEKLAQMKARYQSTRATPKKEPITAEAKDKANKAAKARYRTSKKGREAQARERQKETAELGNRYVRRLLIQKTTLRSADIPQQLVQMKRDELTLRRMARLLTEGAKVEDTEHCD